MPLTKRLKILIIGVLAFALCTLLWLHPFEVSVQVKKLRLHRSHKTYFFDEHMSIPRLRKMLSDMAEEASHLGSRPSWPDPNLCEKDICMPNEIVDITLRPQVYPGSQTNEEHIQKLIDSLRPKFGENGTTYSSLLEEYYTLSEKYQKSTGTMPSWDFLRYPQLIFMEDAVFNVTNGIPVNEKPMNDKPLFLVKRPHDELCVEANDLVFVVKTINKNFDTRKKFRETMNEQRNLHRLKYAVVFTMGLPISDTGRNIQTQFVNSTLQGRAGNVLEDYKDPQKSQEFFTQMIEESEKYGDLLIGSYFDSYYNLTEKCITSWRWITSFCSNAKTVVVLDDDMKVHLKNIEQMLGSWTEGQRRNVVGGAVWDQKQVSRPDEDPAKNRWGLHTAEYPWPVFPPYFSGIGAFFGNETMLKMAIGSAFVQYSRIDDSFIGFLIMKLRIIPEHLPGISYRSSSLNPANGILLSQ